MGVETSLSLRRTFLAYERTLMAWIRTSASLICFGFAIDQFFDHLVQADNAVRNPQLFGPRGFAIGMIACGVIALVISVIQYRHTVRLLVADRGEEFRSLAGKLAVVVSIMGLGVLTVVILRL